MRRALSTAGFTVGFSSWQRPATHAFPAAHSLVAVHSRARGAQAAKPSKIEVKATSLFTAGELSMTHVHVG
jgi:hypothetical protein